MKVLFVSAAAPDGNPRAVVKAQGASLAAEGIEVEYFTVKGGGVLSYLRAVKSLKRAIAHGQPAIVHSHYYLSGIIASLAGASPLVVSLMGSDVSGRFIPRLLSRLFARYCWDVTIVKSEEMKRLLKLNSAIVIPNGVDTSVFYERDYKESLGITRLMPVRRTVIFPGDPARPEKNWKLAAEAVMILNDPLVDLVPLHGLPANRLPWWYSAASAMLSVSKWEGSPNMVKEALACNLPVVATPAGDIPWLIDGVKGCSITGYNPAGVAAALGAVLRTGKRCEGRERIDELQLNSGMVARKIIAVYNESGKM